MAIMGNLLVMLVLNHEDTKRRKIEFFPRNPLRVRIGERTSTNIIFRIEQIFCSLLTLRWPGPGGISMRIQMAFKGQKPVNPFNISKNFNLESLSVVVPEKVRDASVYRLLKG